MMSRIQNLLTVHLCVNVCFNICKDSRSELTINDLSAEAHHNVPLEHDIVPLHASLSLPIEHVKHPPKIWRPLSVIIADLVINYKCQTNNNSSYLECYLLLHR